MIHTDGWAGYHGLVDLGYNKHLRVEHRENVFARQLNHINGIESFWSLAKRLLARFCGVHKRTFYLHLKETEFRFNHRNDNLYKAPAKLPQKGPLLRPLLPKPLFVMFVVSRLSAMAACNAYSLAESSFSPPFMRICSSSSSSASGFWTFGRWSSR